MKQSGAKSPVCAVCTALEDFVCKKMNIIYDASVAHRADYDANVLEQV